MGTAGNVIVGVGDIYVAPANTALPTNPTTKAGNVSLTYKKNEKDWGAARFAYRIERFPLF